MFLVERERKRNDLYIELRVDAHIVAGKGDIHTHRVAALLESLAREDLFDLPNIR